MAESAGCARPTGSRVGGDSREQESQESNEVKEVSTMEKAQVGKAAPDFQAPAYFQGEFTSVELKDFLGKWLLLCFYPGDFTYV